MNYNSPVNYSLSQIDLASEAVFRVYQASIMGFDKFDLFAKIYFALLNTNDMSMFFFVLL